RGGDFHTCIVNVLDIGRDKSLLKLGRHTRVQSVRSAQVVLIIKVLLRRFVSKHLLVSSRIDYPTVKKERVIIRNCIPGRSSSGKANLKNVIRAINHTQGTVVSRSVRFLKGGKAQLIVGVNEVVRHI